VKRLPKGIPGVGLADFPPEKIDELITASLPADGKIGQEGEGFPGPEARDVASVRGCEGGEAQQSEAEFGRPFCYSPVVRVHRPSGRSRKQMSASRVTCAQETIYDHRNTAQQPDNGGVTGPW
jgi:hypothetical protein